LNATSKRGKLEDITYFAVKKCKVPVHTMKAYSGRRGIAQPFLSIGTTQIRMVNFIPQPLLTSEKKRPGIEYDARWAPHPVGHCYEIKNILPLLGFEPRVAQPVPFAVLVHSLYGGFNFYCD